MKKGVVYTPPFWAEWAVDTYGISKKWMNGALVLDPGCGQGALTIAILTSALKQGFSPGQSDLARLKCIERDEKALLVFKKAVTREFGLTFPDESLVRADYLLESPRISADIVFSNPPWVSFGDLDPRDKKSYKPIYRDSGLAPDPRNLLLGGSRIDIAALFVATALNRDMAENGEGFFFLPVSLFRGEGAHSAFRRLSLPGGRHFSLTEVRTLDDGAPFPGAGTRYCFACYRADRRQVWPVKWIEAGPGGTWTSLVAGPADGPDSPLIPHEPGLEPPEPPRIVVPAGTVPRQGINCGGASSVFILEEIGGGINGLTPVINRSGTQGYLPSEMIHPLMNGACFADDEGDMKPGRWIFLPYGTNGRVLTPGQLELFPEAVDWLERHKKILENRKGSLLKQYGTKDIYWALLGVGPYAFAPWKLAWESYGRKRFVPKLFSSIGGGIWQGNQALHAYLPFFDEETAVRVFKKFKSPGLDDYLKKLGGANTKSWAQPGRIRRLLVPVPPEQ